MSQSGIIFDLDGTLVDSFADITAAFCRSFASAGCASPDAAQVRPLIGLDLRDMYERFVDPSLVERPDCGLPRGLRGALCADSTRPFPGIVALLDDLGAAGVPRAVATTEDDVDGADGHREGGPVADGWITCRARMALPTSRRRTSCCMPFGHSGGRGVLDGRRLVARHRGRAVGRPAHLRGHVGRRRSRPTARPGRARRRALHEVYPRVRRAACSSRRAACDVSALPAWSLDPLQWGDVSERPAHVVLVPSLDDLLRDFSPAASTTSPVRRRSTPRPRLSARSAPRCC